MIADSGWRKLKKKPASQLFLQSQRWATWHFQRIQRIGEIQTVLFRKYFNTISNVLSVNPIAGKEELLAQLNPEKIYVENIRNLLDIPYRLAVAICETAVRQGFFKRKVEVMCPDGSVVATADTEEELPSKVTCWIKDETGPEEVELPTRDLRKTTFYNSLIQKVPAYLDRQQHEPPEYTDGQLRTFDLVQRNKMAWFALIFMFAAFAVVLIALLYAAFSGKGEAWLKIGLLLLDGLVGWGIKQILSYLFPTPVPPKP